MAQSRQILLQQILNEQQVIENAMEEEEDLVVFLQAVEEMSMGQTTGRPASFPTPVPSVSMMPSPINPTLEPSSVPSVSMGPSDSPTEGPTNAVMMGAMLCGS